MIERNSSVILIIVLMTLVLEQSLSYQNSCSSMIRRPCFDTSYPSNFSSQIGSSAILNCVIYHVDFSKISISWWKEGDLAELTLGEMVINSRYKLFRKLYNHWSLVIENLTIHDSGIYICQINLKTVLENIFHLHIEPQAITQNDEFLRSKPFVAMPILRGPSLVKANEPFHLKCQVSPVPQKKFGEISLEWRINNKIVQASQKPKNNIHITMQWNPNHTLISYIYIQKATIRHQGVWTCNVAFPDYGQFWELEISRTSLKSLEITVVENKSDGSIDKYTKRNSAQINYFSSVMIVIFFHQFMFYQ